MPTTGQHAWVLDVFGVDPRLYDKPHEKPAAGPSMLESAVSWTKDKAGEAAHAVGAFDDAHGHVLTRAAGAVQMVGGAAEAVTGGAVAGVGGAATGTGVGAAPGIPAMVGGAALAVNGADNAQAGLRTLLTGEFHHTAVSEIAGAGAHALGASDKTADRITNAVDLTQGLAGGVGTAAANLARKGVGAGLRTAAETERAELEAARVAREAAEAAHVPPPAFSPEALRRGLAMADDLGKAAKGSPERARLVETFAKESTHVKPPPDRVVLGKWEPPGKGGYIDDANAKGGVWYETPEGSYQKIGAEAAWETNVAFLRQQLEAGVPRLEFANLKIDKALAEEAARVAKGLPGAPPARVKEILFLEENAPKFGYTRIGDAFVKVH